MACDAGAFEVSTYAIYDGVDYAIDSYQFSAIGGDILPRFAPYISTTREL